MPIANHDARSGSVKDNVLLEALVQERAEKALVCKEADEYQQRTFGSSRRTSRVAIGAIVAAVITAAATVYAAHVKGGGGPVINTNTNTNINTGGAPGAGPAVTDREPCVFVTPHKVSGGLILDPRKSRCPRTEDGSLRTGRTTLPDIGPVIIVDVRNVGTDAATVAAYFESIAREKDLRLGQNSVFIVAETDVVDVARFIEAQQQPEFVFRFDGTFLPQGFKKIQRLESPTVGLQDSGRPGPRPSAPSQPGAKSQPMQQAMRNGAIESAVRSVNFKRCHQDEAFRGLISLHLILGSTQIAEVKVLNTGGASEEIIQCVRRRLFAVRWPTDLANSNHFIPFFVRLA